MTVPQNIYYYSISINLINDLVLLAIVFLIGKFYKNSKKTDNSKTSIILYVIAIVSGVIMIYIQSPILYLSNLTGIINGYNGIITGNQQFNISSIPTIIGGVFIIPIAEEILFRKLILADLLKRYNITIGVIVSTILFVAIHYPQQEQMLICIIGGLLACLFYIIGNMKVIYPILFHISWNFFAHLSMYAEFPFI